MEIQKQKYLYKLYANKLTKVKTLAKKNYFSTEFDKTSTGNVRETWKIINSLIHKRPSNSIPDKIIVDNKTIDNTKEIAEKFNTYFCNVESKLQKKIDKNPNDDVSTFLNNPVEQTIFLSPVLPVEIVKIINSFANKKLCGHNDIPMYTVKCSATVIAPIMSVLLIKYFN